MKSLARNTAAWLKALGSSEDGHSLLELTVMSPLLVVLLVGTIDLGGFMYDGIEIGSAARAGVQYAGQSVMTAGDTAGVTAAVKTDAQQIAGLTVAPTCYCACDSNKSAVVACPTTNTSPCASNDHVDYFVKVVASSSFRPLLKLPLLPSTLTISRTVIQQYSQ